MKKYIDRDIEVLIEEYIDGYSYGHTGNYLNVKYIISCLSKINNILL